MRKNIIAAVIIVTFAGLWLGYGIFNDSFTTTAHATLAQERANTSASVEDSDPTRVQGRISQASVKQREINLRGYTENKRTVIVRSEISGRVVALNIEEGDRVTAGTLLCSLQPDEHAAKVNETRERLIEARITYDGRLKLSAQQLNSDAEIASARAAVASAESALTKSQLDLKRTNITAPYDGYVEKTHAEVGDYLGMASPCVTLLDLDPMHIIAQVSEREVHRFDIGESAFAQLPSGSLVEGTIEFIGRKADQATRTFRVEINVPNPDYSIRSGLTADVKVALGSFRAHRISTALFALDDTGQLGIHTVNDRNTVEFRPINVVSEDNSGVWVTGLPDVVTLITVGHNFVIPGERVVVDFGTGS